ncbi:MAG TPA: M28 family metallopeptidase [Tepidiformaceae bacterium]|nr:M28 family metallopeptidase [Tepidiformaceae bacterium]
MRRVSLVITAASLMVAAIALGVLFFDGDDATTAPAAATPVTNPSSTAAAASLSPTATVSAGGPTGRAEGPAGHDGERAMAILKQLSANPRVAGTAQEAAAAAFLSDLLRSYGYTTEVLPFEFDGDRFRAGTASAAGKQFEALTLAGSPGGKTEAPAAYVGLADAAGIAGQNLTGKIAVADRGSLNFIEKYENAKDAGAIGLIIANNQPGPFTGNLTTLASFPVVSVSQEDGAAFIAAAKAGQRVAIDAPPTIGPTRALNVLARATPGGRCQVLVGGHFDSVPGAPGANDNGSGSANVVELARAFAADGMDEGLCFALFGAEESGLYGSKALVEQFEKAGQLPAYMVNLDVTGIGDDVEVIGPTNLVERALSIAKGLSIPAVKSQLPPNSGSDHQSFEEAGVPALFFTSGDFATIHSPKDVFADISEKELDAVGDVAYATIRDLLAEVAPGQARP